MYASILSGALTLIAEPPEAGEVPMALLVARGKDHGLAVEDLRKMIAACEAAIAVLERTQ